VGIADCRLTIASQIGDQAQEVFAVDRPAGGDVVRVGHHGADIVEHCAKDLLKMFGAFLEVSASAM
jgi:hypothetical protein